MPETTPNLTVSPGVPSDALSDLLHAIHLRSGAITRTTTAGSAGSAGSHHHAAGTRMLHVVQKGELRVECTGAPPVDLNVGDLVLLAAGVAHSLHAPADSGWVTGQFLVESLVAEPVLRVLPNTVVIRKGTAGAVWLPLSVDLMLAELAHPQPGSRVMISRILDLLFIRTLRVWAASADSTQAGWLSAAVDPALGPALAAIHQEPDRDWSVDELARLAALSRSAFATRFAALLGQSPGTYVRRQRLDHAARLLVDTSEPVGRIAEQVGYASEAAFSRAFTRAYGAPPRTWRTTNRAVRTV